VLLTYKLHSSESRRLKRRRWGTRPTERVIGTHAHDITTVGFAFQSPPSGHRSLRRTAIRQKNDKKKKKNKTKTKDPIEFQKKLLVKNDLSDNEEVEYLNSDDEDEHNETEGDDEDEEDGIQKKKMKSKRRIMWRNKKNNIINIINYFNLTYFCYFYHFYNAYINIKKK
jgi:hypothetical protein